MTPAFAYSGRSRAGENVRGERSAATSEAAVAALRREGVRVARIAPAAVSLGVVIAAPFPLSGFVSRRADQSVNQPPSGWMISPVT